MTKLLEALRIIEPTQMNHYVDGPSTVKKAITKSSQNTKIAQQDKLALQYRNLAFILEHGLENINQI